MLAGAGSPGPQGLSGLGDFLGHLGVGELVADLFADVDGTVPILVGDGCPELYPQVQKLGL